MANVALLLDTPVLLINSDNEIHCERELFVRRWVDVPEDVFAFGIRWDYIVSIAYSSLFVWGYDAFRFKRPRWCGLCQSSVSVRYPNVGLLAPVSLPASRFWFGSDR